MKRETIIKSIMKIVLLFIPSFAFSQDTHSDEYYQKAMDFLQGEGILEGWFTEKFLPLYDSFMTAEYGQFILFGQAVAGLGALLYLGNIGWQMVSGDREWEIVPMLKPFAIGLVIMNWVSFVGILRTPLIKLQDVSESSFIESQQELNSLRWVRFKKQQQVVDRIVEEQAKAQAEIQQQEAGDQSLIEEGLDMVGDGLTSLMSPVYELYLRLQVGLQLAISSTLELIGLWILRICVYGIFFIQLIFSTILIIIGPIPVGLSVFPAFSSFLTQWISRFINVNLYGFVAFVILKIGTLLQLFAFEAEIERYDQIINTDGSIKNMDLLLTYSSSGIMSFGLVIVCFLITAVGILCVPTLANYIIPSGGGNTGAMSKMKKAGMAIATKGTSLLKG